MNAAELARHRARNALQSGLLVLAMAGLLSGLVYLLGGPILSVLALVGVGFLYTFTSSAVELIGDPEPLASALLKLEGSHASLLTTAP